MAGKRSFSLVCVRGRRDLAGSPVWVLAVIPTSWKFLILTAYAQETWDNLCFDLRTKGNSVGLSTPHFIICLHLFSSVFMVGRATLETTKPMCIVLGKSCSHEFFPKYCQELLGRQIIPLREVRHHSFFICPNAFVIQRCSCLTSGLCVYMPLKAERFVWVVRVYVQVCLFLCNLDRVTDIQG